MRSSTSSLILALSTLLGVSNAYGQNVSTHDKTTHPVFAHYMAGTTTEEHVAIDINDAIRMGLDGFVLNVGNPLASYTNATLAYMFDYAAKTDFKLLINIDLNGAAGASLGLFDFTSLLKKYVGHDSYFKGPNDAPFISAFSDGGQSISNWTEFLTSVSDKTYFVPDFDQTDGYYSATTGWWSKYGDLVDGLFSWESLWPQDPKVGIGAAFAGDTSLDEIVISGSAAHNKTYMVGLSTLQYKDAYGANYYREGGLNLPVRIENILKMSPSPDFAQILTWNNGPESHYIGNLWSESNDDYLASLYSGSTWDHTAWQPIFTSFITAFKAGLPASKMAPPKNSSAVAVGALWYKTILQDAICGNILCNIIEALAGGDTSSCSPEPSQYSYAKPSNYNNGTDAHNWAVVLDPSVDASNYYVQTISSGIVLGKAQLKSGLNYGNFDGLLPGKQSMQVLDASGNVILATEAGRRGVNATCPLHFNMNYEVVQLRSPESGSGSAGGIGIDIGLDVDAHVGVGSGLDVGAHVGVGVGVGL